MGLGDASGGEDDASAPGGLRLSWRRGGIPQLTTPPSTEDARAARKAAKKAQVQDNIQLKAASVLLAKGQTFGFAASASCMSKPACRIRCDGTVTFPGSFGSSGSPG